MSDWQSVLIPMIRKITPQLIAQELVGVQPMGPLRKELELGYSAEQSYSYWVMPKNFTNFDWASMDNWLKEVMGDGGWHDTDSRWIGSDRRYWFKKESDRTMFVLRWSV